MYFADRSLTDCSSTAVSAVSHWGNPRVQAPSFQASWTEMWDGGRGRTGRRRHQQAAMTRSSGRARSSPCSRPQVDFSGLLQEWKEAQES
jgi:hypothetical protein